ncbi:MAG TPA: glycosyltransferase [Micromonosporaceae bacterium]
MSYAVVIPTVGRESLPALLAALAEGPGPLPDQIVVVNDRSDQPIAASPPEPVAGVLKVLDGPGRGPAAARNVGWRVTRSDWVVFLDDDVVPGPHWREELARDLAGAGPAAGVQGQIVVPLPRDRRPTDWERQVAGLADGRWITADMAYRRDALIAAGGFDERFPRAYREDVDLALRVAGLGGELRLGRRHCLHPVRPAPPWVSVSRQRGNADDALLRRRYGPQWRQLAGLPPGRRPGHAAITIAGLTALTGMTLRRRRLTLVAAAVWLAGTAEFAARRIAPGPANAGEVALMAGTSVLIPPLAVWHWLRGWISSRDVARCPAVALPDLGGDA